MSNDKYDKIDKKIDELVDKTHELDKKVHGITQDLVSSNKSLDKIAEALEKQQSTLEENTSDLKEHMRRTALLEEYSKQHNTRLSEIEKQKIEDEAVSSYKKSSFAKIGKFLATVSVLVGIAVGLVKLISGK